MTLPAHHLESLYSASVLQTRVQQLCEDICHRYSGSPLVVVGVLRGSFMFLADLVRGFHSAGLHPRIDFMTLQSYGAATVSSGNVRILKDVSVDVDGSPVLLVDDILDSGRTLRFACRHLINKGASEVHSCVLLNKPARRVVDVQADFTGFEIPDHFVVGYGLDYDNCYRELPFLAQVIHTHVDA